MTDLTKRRLADMSERRLALARMAGLRRFHVAHERPVKVYDGPWWYDMRVIDAAINELKSGRKQRHWMWFVFPQEEGLGRSYQSRLYALSLDEARRYARDPVLRWRLDACTSLVLFHGALGNSLLDVFASEIDVLKFGSSMELFAEATGDSLYRSALEMAAHDGTP